jgi:hypothetical protein
MILSAIEATKEDAQTRQEEVALESIHVTSMGRKFLFYILLAFCFY